MFYLRSQNDGLKQNTGQLVHLLSLIRLASLLFILLYICTRVCMVYISEIFQLVAIDLLPNDGLKNCQ